MNVAGESFTWRITIKDPDGNLVDPTDITCMIYDPQQALKYSATPTRISLGIYDFSWTSDSNDELGRYVMRVKATVGDKIAIEDHVFMIETR